MSMETTTLSGIDLLHNAANNKGTAFNEQERKNNGLEGLLPPSVESLDLQVRRVLNHLDSKKMILSVIFI